MNVSLIGVVSVAKDNEFSRHQPPAAPISTNASYKSETGAAVKRRIVLSGVNVTEMGLLTVFQDAIVSLVAEYADQYEIIALVHRKSLFDVPGVTFMEYPDIKSSWLKRLRFEYYECRSISKQIKPYLWFAMHDITPNVYAETKAVYCHNPTPFYKFRMKDFLFDRTFGLSTLLYRFLYGISIKSNHFVVVQQDWIRVQFMSWYGLSNIIVAHPSVGHLEISSRQLLERSGRPYCFFYPAFPRPFKNFEQILNAARLLERNGFKEFEIWITTDGTESRYAIEMRREYADLKTVRWLGVLPRTDVMRLYTEADCLIFPSKLETWGMPITEFKSTGKPILAANLPYAQETVGEYGRAAFFNIKSDAELAEMMKQAVMGEPVFQPTVERHIAQPFSRNWEELWKILLASEFHA